MVLKGFWNNKNVLITGHTGFKGSWLSLWLNSLGSKVYGYSLAPNTSPSLYHQLNLEKAIDSKIGDQGAKMSGGQRQRLGLARLFYGNYKFIILDEATSAMDKKLEKKIFDNIYKLKNVTIIIISHNFNILKKCDSIHLINKGKLQDSGTPNYLSKKYKLN